MQPDPTNLMERIGITIPLIGFYDAPDPSPFAPLVKPELARRRCVFAFFHRWLDGKTLHITQEDYGCGGAGHWICGVETRSRQDYVRFLVDDEGLKSSHMLMNQWLDHHKPYSQRYPHILIGPLRQDGGLYTYLQSITFFVNPDQLSVLLLGAQYNSAPGDTPPIIAPFGSGCMQLVTLFENLNIPQAVIGATDIAMRRHLPTETLALTVTKPMFEQLCELDEHSFLHKPFWRNLRKARETR